ncbi:prostatic spermine-binding protein-like [Aphis gossypii]|uniref:prostatic spermine-binding protein-like n=1 Tax=Aphis gossypii TaxID=80765 RepID=UPI00215995F9|nr:prostatic spermine-binding protein-like [Aphis gossypii]
MCHYGVKKEETLCSKSLLRSGGGRVDDDDHENDGDEDDYDNDDDADYDYDDDDYDEQLLDHAQLPMGKWYDTGRHTCTARRRNKESARARCKKDDVYATYSDDDDDDEDPAAVVG